MALRTLFKTRYLPNADGSESATILTNANTVFVHSYQGDDSTGDGTREFPFRSLAKANLKSGVSYMIIRGTFNEYIIFAKYVIGDDINQYIELADFSSLIGAAARVTLDTYRQSGLTNQAGIIVEKVSSTYHSGTQSYNLYKGGLYYNNTNVAFNCFNATILFILYTKHIQVDNTLTNCIIYNSFALRPGSINVKLVNCVFTTTTRFFVCTTKLIQIIEPTWTDDSTANTDLLKTAYVNTGLFTQENIDNIFFSLKIGEIQTNKVIKENKDGGTHPNIFNRYSSVKTTTLSADIVAGDKTTISVVDASTFPTEGAVKIGNDSFYYDSNLGTSLSSPYNNTLSNHSSGETVTFYEVPLDYSLNSDLENEALFAGNLGGYVGALKPQYKRLNTNSDSPINVNADGSDTVDAGTLLVKNANETITFATSTQTWNRIKSNATLAIPNGQLFNGLQNLSYDGSPFGTYIGKYQNLMDSTPISEGTALIPGEWYKVINDTSEDITKSIVYNNIYYMPDRFLKAVGTQSFTLVNAGSGTYLKRLLVAPFESIEVFPYDDETTPSAFPKFSAPLFGDCKLLFYTLAGATRYSKVMGNPVLFSDLVGANFITDFARTGKVATVSVVAGGTGYSVGNVLTLATPTGGWPASCVVTAVSGGVVTAVSIFGKGYLYTTGTKTTTVLPAGGSGCTIRVDTVEGETIITEKIAHYNGYAVSNADWEFFRLADPSWPSPKSTYFTASIPLIKFLRLEINGHYNGVYA